MPKTFGRPTERKRVEESVVARIPKTLEDITFTLVDYPATEYESVVAAGLWLFDDSVHRSLVKRSAELASQLELPEFAAMCRGKDLVDRILKAHARWATGPEQAQRQRGKATTFDYGGGAA